MGRRRGDHLVVWSLDRTEVSESWTALNRGMRRRASQSRELDETSGEITLRHVPTGVMVQGQIPAGHRSRAEMRVLKAGLRTRLYGELEDAVSKVLRVPGRSS